MSLKRIFILIFCFFITYPSFTQGLMNMKYITYYDKLIIDSLTENLTCYKYIIYQVILKNDSIIISDNEDDIATFLFCKIGASVYIKLITKDYIYSTEKIENSGVFTYSKISQTGVDSKENNLQFIPPVLSPFNSEVIIYCDSKIKIFYEFGTVHLYSENTEKYQLRKEFRDLLYGEVMQKIKTFHKEKKYCRKEL